MPKKAVKQIKNGFLWRCNLHSPSRMAFGKILHNGRWALYLNCRYGMCKFCLANCTKNQPPELQVSSNGVLEYLSAIGIPFRTLAIWTTLTVSVISAVVFSVIMWFSRSVVVHVEENIAKQLHEDEHLSKQRGNDYDAILSTQRGTSRRRRRANWVQFTWIFSFS